MSHHASLPFVHRIHTHRVHDVHTVCSQARTNVNAFLWLKVMMGELYHLCAPERIHLQVSHVTPMLVVSTPSHFQSTTARSTTGPRDLLQDNTVHRQPLPQEPLQPLPEQLPYEPRPANALRSGNDAKESLSRIDHESAGNLRNNTPTVYEPKELTTEEIPTISGTSLEDTYQSHNVQRNFGEQDPQAPVTEETRGFGQIQAHGLPDQEMAEMSPTTNMSLLPIQDALRRVCGKQCRL